MEHVSGYLHAAQDDKLILQPYKSFVEAYIDAAFTLHHDSKSHSGVIILVGGIIIFASSRKQKCVTKSPTKSELVPLTDNMDFIELFQEFVSFFLDEEPRTPIIYQDSTSVISLITKGGGITRTKHLRARMNLAKEMIAENKIRVLYKNTSNMIADGLSKILSGQAFKIFKNIILGTSFITD